jgi:aminotransferase EvaB
MKVEYNYLPYEFADVEAVIADWRRLIKTTDFTLGSFVAEFEDAFKKLVGAKHCISTNNGTDALILALRALGVGPGDEVITVTNTFYATAGAVAAVGALPVLVDSDERFQIDVQEIERAITKKTKAVIPVHWAGAAPDMKKILALCESKNIPVLEDACMGIGGLVSGKHPGTLGKLGAFSMHPLKSLNAMGDGGMVVTDDDDLATWMKKYRNHGMVDRDHIEFWGVNMRMQPLQAIVGMHGLKRLSKTISDRSRNAAILDAGLAKIPEIHIPERISGDIETYSLYLGLFERRDKLAAYLAERNIETKIHYPVPLHKQEAASFSRFDKSRLSRSEYQADRLLTIPVHQFLGEDQMGYVVDCIEGFYK